METNVFEEQANARLIAAAPELLDCLREMVEEYEALRVEHGKPFRWGRIPTDKALAAIAKATGSQP